MSGWNSKCKQPVMGTNLACSGNGKEGSGAGAWWVGSQGGENENEGVGRSQTTGGSGFILLTLTDVLSESSPAYMGRWG